MKHLLLTTIAAVLVVGCARWSETDQALVKAAGTAANIESVKQALNDGADVNAKDDQFGGTPLHHVTVKGHKEIGELLIAKGADVNVLDGGGYTPLDRAIKKNHTEIADLLRKHGAKTAEELKAEGK